MRPRTMVRRSIRLAHALAFGVLAWQFCLMLLTPRFPLPLKVAFGILAGFLLVTFYFVGKYFAPAQKPGPVAV
jgi:hypothetical protein